MKKKKAKNLNFYIYPASLFTSVALRIPPFGDKRTPMQDNNFTGSILGCNIEKTLFKELLPKKCVSIENETNKKKQKRLNCHVLLHSTNSE